MNSLKNKPYQLLLLLTLCLIPVILLLGLIRPAVKPLDPPGLSAPEDTYQLTTRTAAEFQPVLVEKSHEQSQLHVFSQQVVQGVDLKQAGILDWDILNKTQRLTYRGTGSFYIDMDLVTYRDISLDPHRHTVTIHVPRPKLAPIDIDPDRFEAEDTQKGLLAFGELKFTAKEYNSLEQEVKACITAAVDTPANRQAAADAAVRELKKLYDPLVKAIDSGYSAEILFIQ